MELALCDWLVESHDLVGESACVSLSSPLSPLQLIELNPGVAGERTVCRELQRRGEGGCKGEEVFCGVALNNVSDLQV